MENLGFMWFFKAGLGIGMGLSVSSIIVGGIVVVGLAVLSEISRKY